METLKNTPQNGNIEKYTTKETLKNTPTNGKIHSTERPASLPRRQKTLNKFKNTKWCLVFGIDYGP